MIRTRHFSRDLAIDKAPGDQSINKLNLHDFFAAELVS
jgi:hypothetical protein